jgi:anti-sigma regulatory factor (Ser/Thr protein kinase)
MRHNLFLYDDDAGLEMRMAPFLRAGLEAEEAVVIVVDERKWQIMREVLGRDADRLTHIDRDTFYTRPEAALAGYDSKVRHLLRDGASSIRVFGELPLCTTPEECATWILYEAILNHAFARHPVWIMCGCDSREQPDEIVEGSLHTHPEVVDDAWHDNPHFHDPAEIVRALTPHSEALPDLRPMPVDGSPRGFRRRLMAEMAHLQVPPVEAENMALAAAELMANAERHGGGHRRVRIGRVADRFVCEVTDHGPGIDDPLAGYIPPAQGGLDGAGLWVARQLTRRLELLTTPQGLTARLWV